MSSKEIRNPIFNDDDLDESDEESDEEEEDDDNVNANSTTQPTPPPPPRNLNDVLDDEEEDDVIDLDNGNDDDDGFNSDPSLVTVAVPPPAQFDHKATNLEPKRPRIDDVQLYAVQEEKKVQQPLDDSRKLFQRLWTDEDEIELLQGFLEYMTQRGISYHNHHDLGLFYEQIKSKLQLDFNKNQLVEKLRRLKRKYRNVLNRTSAGKEITFKSPHDQATYEISRKIWSDLSSAKDGGAGGIDDEDTAPVPIHAPDLSPNPNYNFFNPNVIPPVHYTHLNGVFDERKSQSSKKRYRVKIEEKRASDERVMLPNIGHGPGPGPGPSSSVALGPGIQGLIEETVKSCLSPLIKEALNNETSGLCGSRGFGGISSGVGMLSPLALNFTSPSPSNTLGGEVSDRKWRKQQILELEVYSKRLELVHEQIKITLEELRSGRN